MIECTTVYTYEIDDPEAALAEIRAQFHEKSIFMENTIGIAACHPEFISNGTLKYICDNAEIDIIGITTNAQAVDGQIGELVLTIFIMTADDVYFKAGVTEGLEADAEKAIGAAIEKAADGEGEPPALILAFIPFIIQSSGDTYLKALKKKLPGVPVFGARAADDSIDCGNSKTIFNSECSGNAMSFALCYGNINPRFLIGTFPVGNVMPYKGEITKSDGCVVHEINGVNAHTFFENIGYAQGGVTTDSCIFVPFSLENKTDEDHDSVPVIRSLATFTDDGAAVFLGNVEEGSTFSLLSSNANEVLSASGSIIKEINKMPEINGVLSFSCIIRQMMTMHLSPFIELETMQGVLRQGIPFLFGYAAGEICPTSYKNGAHVSKYHNFSISILII